MSTKSVYLAGDFNIDFIKKSKEKDALVELCSSFNLKYIMKDVSRPNKSGGSCIDNIFTNQDNILATKTFETHMSDHLGQIIQISNNIMKNNKDTIKIRNITIENTNFLIEMLLSQPWDDILRGGDAQSCFTAFHNKVIEIFNFCFPIKTKTVTIKNQSKYRTEELISMKNKLDAMGTIAKVINDNCINEVYRQYKHEYREAIDRTRKLENEQKIINSDNKQKTIWQIINRESGRNRINNEENNNPLTANELNDYFIQVGELVVKEIKSNCGIDSGSSAYTFLVNSKVNAVVSSCVMGSVDEREISEIIAALKNKHTSDVYDMSVNILKKIELAIITPLTQVLNRCLCEAVFPHQLKMAKVIPVFKKGDKELPQNYRPISILPVFSKIFESIIKNKIIGFLEKHNLLSDNQHGYRRGRSTTTAMLSLTKSILEARDDEEVAELTMCDLSKAFDSVPHSELISKLEYYGIRGNAGKLMESYLQNRKQVVYWRHKYSKEETVKCGVPQGSILGAILFMLYINDLPEYVAGDVILYADDTSFLLRGAKEEIATQKRISLDSMKKWCDSNKLKLNEEKTQTLTITGQTRENKESIKFLGVFLDNDFKWESHVEELCKRLSSAIFTIRKIKSIVSHRAAKNTYYANFHSVATYGLLVWGMSSAAMRVQALQKKAIRALCGLNYSDSCREKFKSEKILTITSAYILACVDYVHTNQDKFTKNANFHNYSTRYRENLSIPKHRINITQQAVDYWGPKIYNHLPNNIKSSSSKKFKRSVKELLLKETYYKIDEFLYSTMTQI